MIRGMFEYVALRVLRRFVFSDALLLRYGRYIPYYRTNCNQDNAALVVDQYEKALKRARLPLRGEGRILEVGSGATRSVGYEILRRGLCGERGEVILFEPYVAEDKNAFARLAATPLETQRVSRLDRLDEVPAASVDIIVSHSVLEHVLDPELLARQLARVLAPAGVMFHAVDYRDHFFKYPYHFLCFSRPTWRRWLDPGDLPRWRLQDHLQAFAGDELQVEVLEAATLDEDYRRIAAHVSSDFDAASPDTAVSSALLAVRHCPAGVKAIGEAA